MYVCMYGDNDIKEEQHVTACVYCLVLQLLLEIYFFYNIEIYSKWSEYMFWYEKLHVHFTIKLKCLAVKCPEASPLLLSAEAQW